MKLRIKIGHQRQADKPIYLLHTGAIECGKFLYKGRYKKKFKEFYQKILDLAHGKPRDGVVDVSEYQYWDAIRIWEDHVVARWVKSVSAKQIEQFANETEVVTMLAVIREEFKRAVGLKWRREFKKSDPNDPNRPSQGWQIL